MKIVEKKMMNSLLYSEIQKKKRKKLQEKYGFEDWHVASMYEKQYLLEIYKVMELLFESKDKVIVEVGCGLGDIIGNLRFRRKYGFDISSEVVAAAQKMHKDVVFHSGSFDNIKIGNIDCLIMINFIHSINPKELKKYIDMLLNNNNISYFLFDSVERIKYSEYKYTHMGDNLFGTRFNRIYVGKDYVAAHGAKRHLELWKARGIYE